MKPFESATIDCNDDNTYTVTITPAIEEGENGAAPASGGEPVTVDSLDAALEEIKGLEAPEEEPAEMPMEKSAGKSGAGMDMHKFLNPMSGM